MTMKVLITGMGGFLGRHLARRLIADGHAVHGVSRSPLDIEGAEIVLGDVLDRKLMEDACSGMDAVIHLAAITEFGSISRHPAKSMETSLLGTLYALGGFVKAGGKHFIFPSSGKAYGKPANLPIPERHSLNPETYLGHIKKLCEDLVMFYASFTPQLYTSLRIFNVYGPGQKAYFLIPTILSQLDKEEIILGDIKSRRDYVHVEDVVGAFRVALSRKGHGFEAYNVGSGLSSSAQDVVDEISRIAKKECTIKTDASRLRAHEAFEERADISKLKALGWSPRYTLVKGLSEML